MLLETYSRSGDPTPAALGRVTAHLVSRGFVQKGEAFVRGSLWGTLASFNPRKWAVKVTIEPQLNGHYRLRFEINTTGHAVITDAEQKFWDDEFAATLRVLGGGTGEDLATVESEAVSTGHRALKTITLWSLGVAVLFGVASFVAFKMGINVPPGFPGIGAGLGAVIGMGRLRKA